MDKILTVSEWWGRLGNQLWEVAGAIGLANSTGRKLQLPYWEHARHFRIPKELFGDVMPDVTITEKQYHYDHHFIQGRNEPIVGIKGTLQSWLYFKDSMNDVKEWLLPHDVHDLGEISVSISVRRGDYVNNPNYVQLTPEYYYAVIKEHFSDRPYMFYVCTDDPDYCRTIFKGPQFAIDGRSPTHDLKVMASSHHHILANSSLSWWGCFLSPFEGKNIRPPRTHTGALAHLDEEFMWRPEWTVFRFTEARLVFMCYSDSAYEEQRKQLVSRVRASNIFNDIIEYTRDDIEDTDFYLANQQILDEKRGGGYWLWKPYLILKTLESLPEDTIVFYLDSGDMVYGEFARFARDLMLHERFVCTNGGYKNRHWTKRSCFRDMGCDAPEYWDATQIEAGSILVKNCHSSREFLREWIKWCSQKHIVDDTPSADNFDGFQEHRHDQSILTNLVVKYNIRVEPNMRRHVFCNLQPRGEKIDLRHVTFVTVVKHDSQDRKENFDLMLDFLTERFDTNVIVGETETHMFEYSAQRPKVKYLFFEDDKFHRTRYLNEMIAMAPTEIVFNYDCDIILPVAQILRAVEMLSSGFEFVYPYGGSFLRVERSYYPLILAVLDHYPLEGFVFPGASDNSVGGAVGVLKHAHFRVGGENENYISFGAEDVSRYKRYKKFGIVGRTEGHLYHFNHFLGRDSTPNHDYKLLTESERRREKEMNDEQLWAYIQSWEWRTKYLRQIDGK